MRDAARDAWCTWSGHTGNPSGAHRAARTARRALDDARDVLAAFLGCRPGDVVFTSGGTEADNLAVVGGWRAASALGRPGVVTSAVEHHAVLDPAVAVGATVVGVDRDGVVDLAALAAALDPANPANPAVGLVSVMTVNNEVGTVQPIVRIAEVLGEHAPDAWLHTDAVAAAPWLDLAQATSGAHLVSVSAHKFGGPQGVGALAVKHPAAVRALQVGGGQERERRSGTQNVAGIVAMAAAAAETMAERATAAAAVATRRDRFVERLCAETAGVQETVPRAQRVAGNAHVWVDGVEGEALLFLLDRAGVAASAASSCASGAMERSHVLAALGLPAEATTGAVRFSLGWSTTDDELDHAATVFAASVERLRCTGGGVAV